MYTEHQISKIYETHWLHILTGLKEEIDNSIIIAGDFNTTLSIMDRTTSQKINKDVDDLNNI